MRNKIDRRNFIKNLSSGILPTILTLSLFKPGNSLALFSAQDSEDIIKPRISPAYKVNVFKDGSFELYTHYISGNKKTTTFKGLEADILLCILEKEDPETYNQQLRIKYNLEEEDYISKVQDRLKSFENRGFIYYGETMLVKYRRKKNE